VNIEARVEIGNAAWMKIEIDGETVASGNTSTLEYAWHTAIGNCGSHEIMARAFSGNDTVSHRINLNVSQNWREQSTGFQTPQRMISYISAIDENIAWAVPRDGIYEWGVPIQEFTRTSDGGNTWNAGTIPDCEGLWCTMVHAISDMKAYMSMFKAAGTIPGGIFVTMDGGSSWERQPSASFNNVNSLPVCIHFFNDSEGWCMGDPIYQEGSWDFEIYTTIDAGINWVAVPAANKPAPSSPWEEVLSYSAVNDTLWVGTNQGRIYRSTDKGYNWTFADVTGMESQYVTPVFRNGSHGLVHNFFYQGALIYTGPGTICETFDGGETWTPVAPEGPMYWTDIAYVPGTENTWVSTGGHPLFDQGASYSTDGGHTWTAYEGTVGTAFRQMAWINDSCGWAGGYNLNDTTGGMFKFSIDIHSSAFSDREIKGTEVKVFPNPITPTTRFEYDLKRASMVRITILDPQGKVIDVIQQTQSPGKQHVIWNAAGLPSGVYCFMLQTGDRQVTGKMVVMK
jgi:photosystem II stability/assembly factor-like uncharacterized protein